MSHYSQALALLMTQILSHLAKKACLVPFVGKMGNRHVRVLE